MMNEVPTDLIDVAAEQSVLGAVLLDNNALDSIPFLEPRDFHIKKHEEIFSVMRYMNELNKPIDLITITEAFHSYKKLEGIGGVAYLSELANSCPTAANVEHYAKIVRFKALRRRGFIVSGELRVLSEKGEFEDEEQYFSEIEDKVFSLRPKKSGKMQSFKETRKKYMDHLKSKAQKLLTGFKQFDDWAQMWRGWLYILAGRPGVGKTAKMLQLAYGIAKHNPDGGCVLVYSQEMDEDELKDRIVSCISGVNYNRLINKGGENGFTDKEQEKIDAAYDELEGLPIYVQDSAGVTIDEIRSTAKQFMKSHGKIAAILVDYLQIMNIIQKPNENRDQAIGRVTREAKTIARQMKLVFVFLAQLKRESENREEPKLSDLKESGNIEQDADVVEFLWHDPKDKIDGGKLIHSIFAKGRNVGTNRFRYAFKWWMQRYEELDKPTVKK
jgi:replicative DNA helicase